MYFQKGDSVGQELIEVLDIIKNQDKSFNCKIFELSLFDDKNYKYCNTAYVICNAWSFDYPIGGGEGFDEALYNFKNRAENIFPLAYFSSPTLLKNGFNNELKDIEIKDYKNNQKMNKLYSKLTLKYFPTEAKYFFYRIWIPFIFVFLSLFVFYYFFGRNFYKQNIFFILEVIIFVISFIIGYYSEERKIILEEIFDVQEYYEV
jgi:hypothetical protein